MRPETFAVFAGIFPEGKYDLVKSFQGSGHTVGMLSLIHIYLTDIPVLDYQRHLFEERSVCSVTANTRRDGTEFLEAAARIGIQVSTVAYPMDQANQALTDLAHDRVNGAAVLTNP